MIWWVYFFFYLYLCWYSRFSSLYFCTLFFHVSKCPSITIFHDYQRHWRMDYVNGLKSLKLSCTQISIIIIMFMNEKKWWKGRKRIRLISMHFVMEMNCILFTNLGSFFKFQIVYIFTVVCHLVILCSTHQLELGRDFVCRQFILECDSHAFP